MQPLLSSSQQVSRVHQYISSELINYTYVVIPLYYLPIDMFLIDSVELYFIYTI